MPPTETKLVMGGSNTIATAVCAPVQYGFKPGQKARLVECFFFEMPHAELCVSPES